MNTFKRPDIDSKPWHCKAAIDKTERGTLDFKNSIAGNTVTKAHYKDQNNKPYDLSGMLVDLGPTVAFQISDAEIALSGVLYKFDAEPMAAVVNKHKVQPLFTAEEYDETTRELLDQVDEPWVITKP